VDLLVLDDFCLTPLGVTETSDLYDLVVERHHRASTVVTSNRDPSEWLAVMADALLAQSAIDRLKSAAFELVIEGPSYREREKPTLETSSTKPQRSSTTKRQLDREA
jgi:DNA replication protein DnaC